MFSARGHNYNHCDHLHCNSPTLGRISVGAAQVCDNPVMVLSCLGAAIVNDPLKFLVWQIRSRVQFALSNIVCDEGLVDLITRMVLGSATPVAGQWFACEAACDLQKLTYLESFGYVRQKPDNNDGGSTFWALTLGGMQCVEPVRLIANSAPVLQDRGLVLADRSP